ncbi:MAG: D-glycero-beta-D-manno-heptose 1-phosphate adenylyltransferase [Candidatus Coatesbacteria bacterium]|nr:D-glycero-beta-D-manno-heptose 1-phosphate adenylyltransferase [Candidatus Coatesbacteria bacterium]
MSTSSPVGVGSSEGHPVKVRQLDEMPAIVARLKRAGREVVFTNGCFDLIHNGHVRYLAAARALGDVLLVAVNSDASIRRLKGPSRPITPVAERMELLSAFWFVDYVFMFEGDDPLSAIESLLPDVLVKGSDWALDEIVGREVVEANGGRVERISLVEGVSTTGILGVVAG